MHEVTLCSVLKLAELFVSVFVISFHGARASPNESKLSDSPGTGKTKGTSEPGLFAGARG